jgi:3-oxoacyl-[acyl-carrier protein] reductase
MTSTKCILITGTSRGLGAAIAQAYLLAGECVVGCSRGSTSIVNPNYRHYSLDVSDELAVVEMFADLRAKSFVPRLLLNNAALDQKSLATLTSARVAKDIVDVNLLGTFLICREALKLMQRHRFGRIVNLSSINVPLASVGSSLYNATKAGLDAMGRSFANECRAYDITVNSIGLSLVADTGMVESLSEKAIAAKQAHLLKPKLLEIAEIVAAINFFASIEARNITGQLLYFGGTR